MATPNIVPRADSEGGLGTASKYWASAYIDLIDAGNINCSTSSTFVIQHTTANQDIRFKGIDGSSSITALLLDMSAAGAATFSGNLTLTTGDFFLASGAVINFDGGNVTLTHSSGSLTLADSDALGFGNSNDLKIQHDGSDGYLTSNTGHFYIEQKADDSDIIFTCDDGSGGTTAYLTLDGSAGHTRIYKNTVHEDGVQARFGNGEDFKITHDGSNSSLTNETGDLYIINNADDGDIIFQSDDGSGGVTAYLTLDGGAGLNRFQKNVMYNDNVVNYFGNGFDLQISHDGSNSTIQQAGTGNLVIRNITDDTDVIFQNDDGAGGFTTYFYLDGSSATHDGSATTALYTNWPDNSRISLGTSHDFSMRHDGTNTVLNNNTGDLYIYQSADDKDIIFQSDDGSGGVTTYLTLDGGYSTPQVIIPDNAALVVGTGLDFNIIHDGSNTALTNNTGNLTISNRTDDGDIIFQSDDGSGGVATYFFLDGGLSQPYTRFPDNSIVGLGSGIDMRLYHDGNNSYIDQTGTGDLYIRQKNDDKDIIFQSDDGSGGVETYFYLDGSNNFSQSLKHIRFADNASVLVGSSSDLSINHDGTNSVIANSTGNLQINQNVDDGDLILSCDDGSGGTTPYLTLDGGDQKINISCSNGMQFDDNVRIKVGSGTGGDLRVYHDGSNSFIDDAGTGSLFIRADATIELKSLAQDEHYIKCVENDTVELYHNGSKKFETTSAGVAVTGSLTPSLGVTKPIASAAANVAAAVAGSIYTFSDTDGAVVTLPDSGGGGLVGQTFEFVCTATATSNSHKVIFSDTTNEKFIGRLTAIDTDTDNAQLVYVPVTANKAIVMNGTTTGITGSRFTITNVAADVWMIEGYVHHTGNTANPFANS